MKILRAAIFVILALTTMASEPPEVIALRIAPLKSPVKRFSDMKVVVSLRNNSNSNIMLYYRADEVEWFINGYFTARTRACWVPPPKQVILQPGQVHELLVDLYPNKATALQYWLLDGHKIKNREILQRLSAKNKTGSEPVFQVGGTYMVRLELPVSINNLKNWAIVSSNETMIRVFDAK